MVCISILPIIWLWFAPERRSPLQFGEKSVPFLVKTFFFLGLHVNSGKKVFHFWWRPFFSGLHLICLPSKNHGRGSHSPMLKIGQNLGKIANYTLQCSTRIGTSAMVAHSNLQTTHEDNFCTCHCTLSLDYSDQSLTSENHETIIYCIAMLWF